MARPGWGSGKDGDQMTTWPLENALFGRGTSERESFSPDGILDKVECASLPSTDILAEVIAINLRCPRLRRQAVLVDPEGRVAKTGVMP